MRSIRGFVAFYVQFDSCQNILAANNFNFRLANFSVMFIFKTQIKKNFTTTVVIDVECEAILSKSVVKGLKAQSSLIN